MSFLTSLEDIKHRVRARIPLDIQDRLGFHRRVRQIEARLARDPDIVVVETGNDRRTEGSTWYRGEQVNFMPSRTNLFEKNAIRDYVLSGWLPPKPFIAKDHYITAFGSCFAANVTQFLKRRGYKVIGDDESKSYVICCAEGMVNTYAVAQQFQWAYGEREFDESLWFDETGAEAVYDAGIRERTRAIFEQAEVFIVTLGLSEVWYSKKNGDVFWRAIPRSKFDPSRHGFKVTTVSENLENLENIRRIVRRQRPQAAIIFTLSPIPLLATFRPESCITANTVSKSILRVALDELCRAHRDDKKLFYFPSFEIVKEFFRDPYRGDNRHVRQWVLDEIMENFAKYYLVE
jgi:hypothetical protein